MKRRTFLSLAGSTAIGAALARPSLSHASDGPAGSLAAVLRDPPASVRPQVRWWWPGGTIMPAEVRREVGQIADAGFGGFEIADVRDSVTDPVDPATLGWASAAWNRGVEAALEEALDRGVTPSLTLGPHWPTGVPGIVPDDAAASKELVYGLIELEPGAAYSGPMPSPVQNTPSGALPGQNASPPVTPELLALQAYRVAGEHEGLPLLDPASLTAIEPGDDGRFAWTAPSDGRYMLFSFWMRGTGQIQNMFGMNRTASMLANPIPYVLDIYGPAAVEALTGYWEENLLSPRIRDLMRQAGGTFFEDSLELSFAWPWTPTAVEEFRQRRGYDIVPYLPLLVSRQPTMNEMILGGGRPEMFAMSGVETERVRHDFDRTLSEMYVDYRLQGLSDWADRLGMKFRVQAIGSEINSGLAAAHADIPEGDNSNDIHGWRKLAAGRDIGGKSILSDEAATFVRGIAHVADWKDTLYMLQRDMVGGANQILLHGFSYADAPGAAWPGFSAFGRAIGNDWGPRDPQWRMAPGVTAYLGRMQALLREGRTQADLAVLGEPLKSQAVLHAGYTFQYPAMELFDWPTMTVSDGVLMPDGPRYRAVILNGLDAIDLSVARKLAAHVDNGLPIVIVGAPPMRARGWLEHEGQDREIAAIMQSLSASPLVRCVGRQAETVEALASLGVASALGFSEPHRILALHRSSEEMHLFYLLNDSDLPTDQDLCLGVDGLVYRVDLWSGAIESVPAASTGQGRKMRLSLAANEPAMIIVTEKPVPGAIDAPARPSGHARQLGSWSVEFEQWLPGEEVSSHTTRTTKLDLETLKPWREYPGFEGMAGIARYRATVTLGKVPASATLDFGSIAGAATLSVNGSPNAPINPFTSRTQVGALLKRGVNTIEVSVASPLNNLLLAEGIEDQGFKPPVDRDEGPPPPPPPELPVAEDPDLVDGPSGMTGMQPGAAPPGVEREYRDYGLLGPVRLLT